IHVLKVMRVKSNDISTSAVVNFSILSKKSGSPGYATKCGAGIAFAFRKVIALRAPSAKPMSGSLGVLCFVLSSCPAL
ncbi:MAG TPA: hypothetical protein VFM90_08215, partial [Cyclobacteriaceae bacterium]|nr:hypothetical protein [Cyclobacteriaceae bacterium]